MIHEEAALALAPNILRRMYEGIKMDPQCCASCRKIESLDKPFPECAGCNLSIYCSRECQKSHWKIHKSSCLHTRQFGIREMNKIRRRVSKFRLFYAPLLDLIAVYRYALYNKTTKGKGRPKNHIVAIRLHSLPDSVRNPRLGIEKIVVREILPGDERGKIEATARREKYFSPYACEFQGFSSSETMCSDGDMMDKIRSVSKEDLLKHVTGCVQTINDIANGLRPDLFQTIAECMK